MKNSFVLDENIIYSMSTFTNEKGDIDFSAGHLMYSIADNCHNILVTNSIYTKYLQKYNELKRAGNIHITNAFIHLLNQMIANSEKTIWDADTDVAFPDDSFDPDDYIFVALASKRNAILVTSDCKLIRDLTNSSVLKTYNFEVKRPEEAIKDAS